MYRYRYRHRHRDRWTWTWTEGHKNIYIYIYIYIYICIILILKLVSMLLGKQVLTLIITINGGLYFCCLLPLRITLHMSHVLPA